MPPAGEKTSVPSHHSASKAAKPASPSAHRPPRPRPALPARLAGLADDPAGATAACPCEPATDSRSVTPAPFRSAYRRPGSRSGSTRPRIRSRV
ncbi:hypothetical protein G6F58_013518 [Rhizopus delemar]|nr:hypothetical protein G6F58_013518 [Rhizopus delemar]